MGVPTLGTQQEPDYTKAQKENPLAEIKEQAAEALELAQALRGKLQDMRHENQRYYDRMTYFTNRHDTPLSVLEALEYDLEAIVNDGEE